jgi:hypothetical protein
LFSFSPGWVQDIIDLLGKLYSNPAYLEVHPDPKSDFLHVEDIIKVINDINHKTMDSKNK